MKSKSNSLIRIHPVWIIIEALKLSRNMIGLYFFSIAY